MAARDLSLLRSAGHQRRLESTCSLHGSLARSIVESEPHAACFSPVGQGVKVRGIDTMLALLHMKHSWATP